MTKQNYYEVFGVSRSANNEEIKRTYRLFAQKFHPDKNLQDSAWATGMMKKINEAWLTLSDPERKKLYDAELDWKEKTQQKERQNTQHEAAHKRQEQEKAEREKKAQASQREERFRQEKAARSQSQASDRAETARASQRQDARRKAEQEESARRQKINDEWEKRFRNPDTVTSHTPARTSASSFDIKSQWIIYILIAGLVIAMCSEKSPKPPADPQVRATVETQATPIAPTLNVVSLESAIATIEREINDAQWASYLPNINDVLRRFLVFQTPQGKLALDRLRIEIESKRMRLNNETIQTPNVPNAAPRKNAGTCSTGGLESKSITNLCSVFGTARDICHSEEVRIELENRGVFVFEGGCGQYVQKKTRTAPHTAQQAPNTATTSVKLYNDELRFIEMRHPELNPDNRLHRNGLVDQAVKRMQSYEGQGIAKHEALRRGVLDMEREGQFMPTAQVDQAKRINPSVFDPGGHSGFDPKCRWLNSQEWSCK